MIDSKNLFWDSCVFIRYLSAQAGAPLLDDISRFIDEARAGKRFIHYSSIMYTELISKHFKGTRFGSIHDFLSDLGSNFIPIEPNPNILLAAGELRGSVAVNPSDPKDNQVRVFGTPDAIHLMSCLFARDVMEIKDIVFHTLDEGKGRSWEGKCIPLLGMERWFPEGVRTERVAEVCGLTRCKPFHPSPSLGGMLAHDNQADTK